LAKRKYVFGYDYFDKALRDKHITSMLYGLVGEPEGPRKSKVYLTLKRTTVNDTYVIDKFMNKWWAEESARLDMEEANEQA
jgi:hypothetical protein